MNIWPVHLKPFEDELLSYWIARLAFENQIPFTEFCKLHIPSHQHSIKELDTTSSDSLFNALSIGTGTPIERVVETTLFADEGYIFNYRLNGITDWISPSSFNVLEALKYWSPVCPYCLEEDAIPYYRKSWCYSFNNVCPKHMVFVGQVCTKCKASCYCTFDETYRTIKGVFNYCRCDSKKSTQSPIDDLEFLEMSLSVQQKFYDGIKVGIFKLNDYHIPSIIYLRFIHTLTTTLSNDSTKSWVFKNFPNEIPNGLISSEFNWDIKSSQIESKYAYDAAALLCLAEILTREWPYRLEKFLSFSGKSINPFKINTQYPFFIADSLPQLCFPKKYQHTQEEVNSAAKILKRSLGRKELQKEITAFMKSGVVKNLEKVSKETLLKQDISAKNFSLETYNKESIRSKIKHDDTRKLINAADKLSKIAVLRKVKKKRTSKPKDQQLDLFGIPNSDNT